MCKKILYLKDDKKTIENILEKFDLEEYSLIALNKDEIKTFPKRKNSLFLLNDSLKNISRFVKLRKNSPFVVIGNEIESENMCEYFDLGAEDYILKSSNINIIIARIKAIFRRL